MRLIDADILENMGYELHRTYRQDASTMVYEVKKIADVPTVKTESVRHGRWIREPNCWYRCAICGDHYPSITGNMKYNYCPTCGTRMVEEE